MKRIRAVSIIVSFLLVVLCSCNNRNDPETKYQCSICVGMSFEDVEATLRDFSTFEYIGYLFYRDTEGQNVVARFDQDMKRIEEIKMFDPVSIDAQAFETLRVGMTIYEVVERIGLPTGSYTFGIASLNFESKDGTVAWVQLDGDKVIDISIKS